MPRARFPIGFTTVSRLKTLVLHLEATRGREAAAKLVREVEIDPELLDDETRPIPITTWLRGLEAFAALAGREEIVATSRAVIAPENLGVFTHLLRGASDLDAALGRLDELGREESCAERWETLARARGRWRGAVTVAYDPKLDPRRLGALARAAELSALPELFGFGAGGVELLEPEQDGARQELVLTWSGPSLAAALGASFAVTLLAGGGAWLVDPSHAWTIASAFGVGGVVASLAWERDRGRRAQAHAQNQRIAALERSVALKEAAERVSVGFLEGSVVAGKYRLGPKLGAGATGVIHRATRLVDNGTVAIKLLRAAAAHDAVASDRLRREAEALGLAWHPNIVEVYEHGVLPDGTAFLVLESLEGPSLATLLERERTLPPALLARVALQACDALGAVHAAGIVHRDVKPANILVTGPLDAAEGPAVKLIDFGIARVEWAETRLTNAGTPLGTPGYMSPEQERGADIDARSDIFALGAVLYECLTGRVPPQSGLWRTAPPARGGASADGSDGGAIPPAWREIIDRAMAPLPQERWADARKMRDAIVRATRGSPGMAGFSPGPPLADLGSGAPLADLSSGAPLADLSSGAPLADLTPPAPSPFRD